MLEAGLGEFIALDQEPSSLYIMANHFDDHSWGTYSEWMG